MVVRAGTVGVALALALVSLVLIAGASTAQTRQFKAAAEQKSRAESFDTAVALMERHMSEARDGTLALDESALAADLEDGAAAGVNRSVFEELQDALNHTNRKLKAGRVKASEVFPSSETERLATGDVHTSARCAGVNSAHTHWYGWHIMMNDCRTHTYSYALGAGFTVWQIRSIVGKNVPLAIAATLGSFASRTVDYIDIRGGHRGIHTKITWSGATFYFWHQ